MISIRLNETAEQQLKKIAEFEGVSVSEYVRQLINEKLEDTYDLSLAEEAYAYHVENGRKTLTHDDFWRGLSE